MKFKGYGIVWDTQNDSPLAEFTGGIFETEDEREINTLTNLGYKSEIEEIKTDEPKF